MGLLDKAKFWKKKEDDFGDLSGLGDFGLDKTPGTDAGLGGGIGDMSFPPLGSESPTPAREEVHPSAASQSMGDQLGLRPTQPQTQPQTFPQPAPQQYQQQQPMPQYQQPLQQYQQNQDTNLMLKDLELVHAKLDSIKASLDAINQRLATLERIATGDTSNRSRYNW